MNFTTTSTLHKGTAGELQEWLEKLVNAAHPGNAIDYWSMGRPDGVAFDRVAGYASAQKVPETLHHVGVYVRKGSNEGHFLEVVLAPHGEAGLRTLCSAKCFGGADDAWRIARTLTEALEDIFYYYEKSVVPDLFDRLPKQGRWSGCREAALQGPVRITTEKGATTSCVIVRDQAGFEVRHDLDSPYKAQPLAKDWMLVLGAQSELDVELNPYIEPVECAESAATA